MRYLILLPLFALLPFIAFPNVNLEKTMDVEEISTEVLEGTAMDEVELKDCTVTIKGEIDTPIGGVSYECKAKAVDCAEAVDMAIDCVKATKDAILDLLD